MKYRAEIDGLRALAVVPVILFHAGFDAFSGGFVGVDIFFVISGYLITTILVEDINQNRFSLTDFYERRARRILPALFSVILICIPFALMILVQPDHKKDFGQSLVAVSLFASNFLFWIESDYFDVVSEYKPLLHTWSLAVEEQYYLLFPVFLSLVWRFGKNIVFWIIIFLAFVSLILSEWGWRNFPSANFYLAPSRSWELFAGSISAFIIQNKGVRKNNLIAFIGILAIIYSILFYNDTTPFPSIYTLVPVLGTVLLILFAHKDTIIGYFLSLKIFVGIGLVSYSAYLWHQPLFAFTRILLVDEVPSIVMILLSLLVMLIAFLSWKFIEQPFRNRSWISKKNIFSFSIIGILIFSIIGLYTSYNYKNIDSGFVHPYKNLFNLNKGSYEADNKLLQKMSWNIVNKHSEPDIKAKKYFFVNSSNKKSNMLLLGNSHSKDIFNIFYNSKTINSKFNMDRYGIQISELDAEHIFWNSSTYQLATHILIATRYREPDIINLPNVIDQVKKDGKKLFIVSHIFEFPGDASGFSLIDKTVFLNKDLDSKNLAEKVNKKYYEFYINDKENNSYYFNNALQEISRKYNIDILDRMNYVCSDAHKKCYVVQSDLTKNFYDYGHHTLEGAVFYANSKMFDEFISKLINSLEKN